MTKRYQILQKKLRELDASIGRLSALYPATPSHLLPDIAQQLLFSRKLLSAEISSHPSKPHHLAHISQHLDRLDAIFRGYQEDHQHDPDHDDNGDFAAVDGLDAASACSCTESCLNDDGEGELGSELCEEPEEMFYEAPGGHGAEEEEEEEKVSSVEVGRVVVERSKSTEKGTTGVEIRGEEGDCVWWCFGVLGGGLVVGAVLMCAVMVRFSGCFHSTDQYEGFLVPT